VRTFFVVTLAHTTVPHFHSLIELVVARHDGNQNAKPPREKGKTTTSCLSATSCKPATEFEITSISPPRTFD
jgi:hypothetical protein